MKIENLHKYRLPVPKTTPWNQSNPQINLNDFHNFGKVLPESALIKVYNLSNTFLGLGMYAKETNKITFLSGKEDQEIQVVLETILDQKIHHQNDHLPGMVIQDYDKIFIIRTYDSGADLLIPELTKIITKKYQAKAILLKNHFKARQKLSLPLSDQILCGSLESDTLEIQEGPFTFTYNTKTDFDLFPLGSKSIRLWFNQRLLPPSFARRGLGGGRTPARTLIIGINKNYVISKETQPILSHCEQLPTDNLSLTQITENLRKISNKITQPFDQIAINQFPIFLSEKNKTALFHIYHQIIKSLTGNGHLFLQCEDWRGMKQLINHVARKLKRKMSVREKITENTKTQLWLQFL